MTSEQRRRELGIGLETTSGKPVIPMQWVPENRDRPWWTKREFWNGDELEMGDDGVPLLVAEAQRRGAERLAIDHVREGKIMAGEYMRRLIMMKYVCRVNNCDRVQGIGKACQCPESRVLRRVIMDIDEELETLKQPEIKHL